MKLKTCLVACDLNKFYLDFFPLVKKCWETIVGINVILVLIGDHLPLELEEYKDNVRLFKPIENIPTAFQAQCIRILYPALLEIDEFVIISDMDLIPLNKKFYDICHNYDSNSFIVYRDCISHVRQYPICFCAATPRTWKNIFQINSENDIKDRLLQWYIPDYGISNPYSHGWCADQVQLFRIVNECCDTIIKLNDSENGFKRLDRSEIISICQNIEKYKLMIHNGEYSDFHLPRPYSQYKEFLHKLLDHINMQS